MLKQIYLYFRQKVVIKTRDDRLFTQTKVPVRHVKDVLRPTRFNAGIANSAIVAETTVDKALRQFNSAEYLVFQDLIIPANHRTLKFTQIDHVIVSIYGIFCIETKSNSGTVYGYSKAGYWTQYLGGEQYKMYNPVRQNMLHARSIERVLSGSLRAPVHSYLAFPNARKIVLDGEFEDMSTRRVLQRISAHQRQVYDLYDVERIAKTLAHLASMREELRDVQLADVQRFVAEKVKKSMQKV